MFTAMVPALIIGVLLCIYFTVTHYHSLEESLKDRGVAIASRIAPAAGFGMLSENMQILDALTRASISEPDVQSIIITDTLGSILTGKQNQHSLAASIPTGKPVQSITESRDDSAILVNMPIFFNVPVLQAETGGRNREPLDTENDDPRGTFLGWIVLALDRKSTRMQQRTLIVHGILITLFILLFASFLARSIGRSVIDPVCLMTDTVKEISKGNMNVRVKTTDGAELGALEQGINTMASVLAHAQEELQTRVERATTKLRSTLIDLEEKNRELETERVRAQYASQAKSQFLANMSHELRTPLNAIIGYSEMMMEEARDSGADEFVADLEKIQISGNHLLLLINDVLDLSKIEAGKMDIYPEEFRIPALLDDIVRALKPLVEKNHNKIHIEIESDPGPVHTDMTKLRQTLYNLISNASKFTYDGTITVIVRSEIDDLFSIIVKDTGIGMDKTQVDRLFRPFTQADSSTTRHYGGTGLGLTVSKHFCEMLGGTISVDSALGKGSEFAIRIPRNIDDVKELSNLAKVMDRPFDAGDIRFTGIPHANEERRKILSKVLVIDDEDTVCDLLEKFLSREGFYIRTAGNGKDGLKMAEEFRPDVITLDVMMPRMDGWSVLRKLKSGTLTRDIPVIILSVIQDKQMAKDLGASDCLTKPIDWEKLFTVIKQQVRKAGAQAVQ